MEKESKKLLIKTVEVVYSSTRSDLVCRQTTPITTLKDLESNVRSLTSSWIMSTVEYLSSNFNKNTPITKYPTSNRLELIVKHVDNIQYLFMITIHSNNSIDYPQNISIYLTSNKEDFIDETTRLTVNGANVKQSCERVIDIITGFTHSYIYIDDDEKLFIVTEDMQVKPSIFNDVIQI